MPERDRVLGRTTKEVKKGFGCVIALGLDALVFGTPVGALVNIPIPGASEFFKKSADSLPALVGAAPFIVGGLAILGVAASSILYIREGKHAAELNKLLVEKANQGDVSAYETYYLGYTRRERVVRLPYQL